MKNFIRIYTDGATVGKNGKLGTVKEVGLGVFIPVLYKGYCKKTNGISNNEAEFKALILGMKIAIKKEFKFVKFFLDSKIVVNRANGLRPSKPEWKNERMDKFQDEVLELKKKFEEVSFEWVPREDNAMADYYSKLAIV
jgi:ribonuclease HI